MCSISDFTDFQSISTGEDTVKDFFFADGKYYVFVQTDKKAEEHHEEGEVEADHKEGEETEHKEDKTSKNFEKLEVLKGVSDMGYTAVTFVNQIPANAKIVVKGAFFVNAKLSNTGGHEH